MGGREEREKNVTMADISLKMNGAFRNAYQYDMISLGHEHRRYSSSTPIAAPRRFPLQTQQTL
jgi:hypothetical protein